MEVEIAKQTRLKLPALRPDTIMACIDNLDIIDSQFKVAIDILTAEKSYVTS